MSNIIRIGGGKSEAPAPRLDQIQFTDNGEYYASSYGIDGFNKVTVNVPTSIYYDDVYDVPVEDQTNGFDFRAVRYGNNYVRLYGIFNVTGTIAAYAKVAKLALPEGMTLQLNIFASRNVSNNNAYFFNSRTDNCIYLTEGSNLSSLGTITFDVTIPISVTYNITAKATNYIRESKTYFGQGDRIFMGQMLWTTRNIPNNENFITLDIGDLVIQPRYLIFVSSYPQQRYICYIDADGKIYNRNGGTITSEWISCSDEVYLIK